MSDDTEPGIESDFAAACLNCDGTGYVFTEASSVVDEYGLANVQPCEACSGTGIPRCLSHQKRAEPNQ